MVEQGKFFPHRLFSHLDHSVILHKCNISHHKRKIRFFIFKIYLFSCDVLEPCANRQLYCSQCSTTKGHRANESQPSAPVSITSQSKTHTTGRRFSRSSLTQRHGKAYAGYTSSRRNCLEIGQKRLVSMNPVFHGSKLEILLPIYASTGSVVSHGLHPSVG